MLLNEKKAVSKRIVNFISKFSFFFFFNGNWWKLSRYGKHFLILCFIFLIYFQIRSQKQQKKDVEPIYATKIPHMTIFWITTAKQILVSILIFGLHSHIFTRSFEALSVWSLALRCTVIPSVGFTRDYVYWNSYFIFFFVVVKMKFKTIRKRNLQGRKVNSVYKAPRADKDALRKLRKPKLKLQSSDECCAQWIRRQPQKTRFLVMGNSEDSSMESLVPTFIIPWSRNKVRKLH